MPLPPNKMHRVIINTDAKNEADDQYAIVQALLTPSFDLHGIIPAHFGDVKSKTSLKDSHDEVHEAAGPDGPRRQGPCRRRRDGRNCRTSTTPADSAGARLIIEEAMKDDPRPLHVAFLGPLTDMAAAILLEPRIVHRNVRVVWIGGGALAGRRPRVQPLERHRRRPTWSSARASRSGRSR